MIVTPPTAWSDKGSIEIYKKDINGKNLNGAEFTIYDKIINM